MISCFSLVFPFRAVLLKNICLAESSGMVFSSAVNQNSHLALLVGLQKD